MLTKFSNVCNICLIKFPRLKLLNSNYKNAAVSTVLSRVRAKGGFGILYTLLKPKASALL